MRSSVISTAKLFLAVSGKKSSQRRLQRLLGRLPRRLILVYQKVVYGPPNADTGQVVALRAVVIEDHPILRDRLGLLLRQAGYRTVRASLQRPKELS